MTIKQKLHISFALILAIIIFIIGAFFYTIYNLNEIHLLQNDRYDQMRRVEKLKEYNNSFAWIVLDVLTDYDKKEIVNERIKKAQLIFKKLYKEQYETIQSAESQEEKENLELIFSNFIKVENLINNDLYQIILLEEKEFSFFNKVFDKNSKEIEHLLDKEIDFLQNKFDKTEDSKDNYIDKIKLELVILLFIAFSISFIISSRIIKEIQQMLDKLNKGVLQLFNNDENTIKVDIGKNNELSEITDNLNSYLEKQRDIIYSREELLRNISHELKTPITKGKFLLEKIKDKNDLQIIDNIDSVFIDIEELTSKLLQREKLNFATLNISKFKVSSLVLEALSKLSIEDETQISLDLEDDFTINGDKYYLTLALKNLIDNALKYTISFPIEIQSKNHSIFIKNRSKKLSNDIIYYIQPFTREPHQQHGHGLGLNIVNKIVQMHKFTFSYKYSNSYNIFYIQLK